MTKHFKYTDFKQFKLFGIICLIKIAAYNKGQHLKKMKRYIITFFTLIALNASSQIPVDSIKAIIKREVLAKRSKSIIVGIVDRNGLRQIFAEGILSDDDRRLPDAHTIYEIGSITKVFTSLLLADMSLKHQLSLNDPISKYLPKSIKTPLRNGKEISLLSLSTHRSGMPRFPYNVDPKNLDEPYVDYTMAQLHEYVSKFSPEFDIDSKWRYSNTAYGLLGDILSRIAKKDFETLVKEKICRPLNLPNTIVKLNAKQKRNVALGYAETGVFAGFTELNAIAAGGALRSNVDDMLTFTEANLGIRKSSLYPAIKLTHQLQAKKDGNDTYTTMGWTLSNNNGEYHLFKDGGTLGYRSFIGIDTVNKIGVVVLSNSNNSVTDIGRHILSPTQKVQPYQYPWTLLDTMRVTVKDKGTAAAIELYMRLKTENSGSYVFNEMQLNYLGDELRRAKQIEDAIKIYELNLITYPNSTLVYESLGETYKRNHDKKTALKYFDQAKTLDPQNQHWDFIIEKLQR